MELNRIYFSKKKKISATKLPLLKQFRIAIALLALFTAWFSSPFPQPVLADSITQQAKLTAPPPTNTLGHAVAISGNIVVVGDYGSTHIGYFSDSPGAIYIYETPSDGWGDTSIPVAIFEPSDGERDDRFGYAVAISGNTIVVGAYLDDDKGVDSGSAYIYEKQNGVWALSAKLTASDGSDGDGFGRSVGISGNTVIIGARNASVSGALYIYEKPNSGWNTTDIFNAQLTPSDGTGNLFGHAAAISGDTIIVGAYADDAKASNSGGAYIYEKPNGGWGSVTNFSAKLAASDGVANDWFGYTVAIHGDTAIISATRDDDEGSVYVYEKPSTGWSTTEIFDAKLTSSNSASSTTFGWSLAIENDTIIVGMRYGYNAQDGVVSLYTYEKPTSGWSTTDTSDNRLIPSEQPSQSNFGEAVAISGNTVVAGSSVGKAAYVFGPSNSSDSPTLSISDQTITFSPENGLTLDINLTQNGANVASTGFSIDYDSTCLTFAGEDGLSGLPIDFAHSLYHDTSDSDGEIDIALWKQSDITALPDGAIATLTFALKAECISSGTSRNETFHFSADPSVSFGDSNGGDVSGTAYNGTITMIFNSAPVAEDDPTIVISGTTDISVLINDSDADGDLLTIVNLTDGSHGTTSVTNNQVTYLPSNPAYNGTDSFTYQASDGIDDSNVATVNIALVADDEQGDCNASNSVTAADFVAIALEILDGDDALNWYEIYQGDYDGSPLGCDANGSRTVDAPDIIYTVNLFFGNATLRSAIQSDQEMASLVVIDDIAASAGEEVKIPIALNSQNSAIAAAAFRLDFDESHLTFDPTDANGDGLPDTIQFQAPEGMLTIATYDANNGYLDIALVGVNSPMPTLADGEIVTVSFKVSESATTNTTAIQLTQGSLGSADGQDLAVNTANGTLAIAQPGGVSLIFQYFLPTIPQ